MPATPILDTRTFGAPSLAICSIMMRIRRACLGRTWCVSSTLHDRAAGDTGATRDPYRRPVAGDVLNIAVNRGTVQTVRGHASAHKRQRCLARSPTACLLPLPLQETWPIAVVLRSMCALLVPHAVAACLMKTNVRSPDTALDQASTVVLEMRIL